LNIATVHLEAMGKGILLADLQNYCYQCVLAVPIWLMMMIKMQTDTLQLGL